MRYDTVVFDLDGTLLNTLQDLADAANYVCRAHGWPEHTLDEYRYFVGNGIPKLCQRFAPETARDEASQKEVLAQFSARYAAHKEDTTAPYPGIEAMLEALSAAGVRYGVLTNKEHTLAQGVMDTTSPAGLNSCRGRCPACPPSPTPRPCTICWRGWARTRAAPSSWGTATWTSTPPTTPACPARGCCGASAQKKS